MAVKSTARPSARAGTAQGSGREGAGSCAGVVRALAAAGCWRLLGTVRVTDPLTIAGAAVFASLARWQVTFQRGER